MILFNVKPAVIKAWKAGQKAAQERKSIKKCPYQKPILVQFWKDGYYSAQ